MLANKLRGIARSTTGGDQLFTSSGTFTVPAGVTSFSVAVVPGTTTSKITDTSNNVILSATRGTTSATFTTNGNTTIPLGVTTLSLTGKGGNPYSYPIQYSNYNLIANQHTYTVNGTPVNVPPSSMTVGYQSPPWSSFTVTNDMGQSASIPLTSYNPSNGYSQYVGMAYQITGWPGAGTQTASIGATYSRTDVNTTGTTSGTATSANFNSTNYTFPGVSSGIAPTTTQTIYSSGATALTLSWNIGTTNGSFSYSYPPFAINHTSQMTGSSTYNILGNVSAGGPYTGGIAAWRNNFAVSAGQTYNITISSGGAVRVMWGAGRSFPSNAT